MTALDVQGRCVRRQAEAVRSPALQRARAECLEDAADARRFFVASPEDTILAKLEWFRAGGEQSERQWGDVVGVLKTGGAQVDRGYLKQWAAVLRVDDLLERALAEVGAE